MQIFMKFLARQNPIWDTTTPGRLGRSEPDPEVAGGA
jgi:hypothetical protein